MTASSTSRATAAPGPCSGLRVIELAAMVSGPFCGQMLAAMGAEVIKIEPITGDPLRMSRPHHRDLGALFAHHNAGKKSIGVDLTTQEGRLLVLDLIRGADVVLENFRPGVLDKLGLGYSAISEVNARIVLVSISGYGQDGPYAKRPAYDQSIQAMAGFMWVQGSESGPEPIRSTVVDRLAGVTACHGTLAALLHRERTGEGQHVSIPLLDAFMSVILPGLTNNQTFLDAELEPYEPRNIYQPIPTRDGYVMGHVQTDAQFKACATMFGRPDLLTDQRFTTVGSRLANIEAFWHEIAVKARDMTTSEVVALATEHGVPLNKVNRVADAMRDPQVLHNETFVEFVDPEFGRMRQLNSPVRFSVSRGTAKVRAPKLGEHTDDLLRGVGVSDERIAQLRAGRIVR